MCIYVYNDTVIVDAVQYERMIDPQPHGKDAPPTPPRLRPYVMNNNPILLMIVMIE